MGYRTVRALIRLLLWLFYRRVEVSGIERVPASGPVVIAANHHNSLVDAMLVVGTLPRRVAVLANAPLFRNPLIGPFLRLIGAVPVHRRQEAGDDPGKNEAMFQAAAATLRAGGALLIFPEGRTQPQPSLLPLRTGAARIVFAAERAVETPAGVTLLPVGLVFHDPGTFRAASVLVSVGPPVPTADLVAQVASSADGGVRVLTERLTEAIRAQIMEAEDRHTLELLGALEEAWREERSAGASVEDPSASLGWRQQVMRAARYLAERDPDRVAAVRRRVELYLARLEEAGLSRGALGLRYTPKGVARYVLENALVLALVLPLALWGIASHTLPYALTGAVVRRLGRTAEEEATDKLAAGLVLYPVCWLVEGWLAWWLLGPVGLLAFAVLLVPAGLVALAWRDRLSRVGHQARAFVRFCVDRQLLDRLRAERRGLVEELMALARLVPEAVLKGRPRER